MFTDRLQQWDLERVLGITFTLVVAAATVLTVVALVDRARGTRPAPGRQQVALRVVGLAALVSSLGLMSLGLDVGYVAETGSDYVVSSIVECGSAEHVLLDVGPAGRPAQGRLSNPDAERDACESAAQGRLPSVLIGLAAGVLLLWASRPSRDRIPATAP